MLCESLNDIVLNYDDILILFLKLRGIEILKSI